MCESGIPDQQICREKLPGNDIELPVRRPLSGKAKTDDTLVMKPSAQSARYSLRPPAAGKRKSLTDTTGLTDCPQQSLFKKAETHNLISA